MINQSAGAMRARRAARHRYIKAINFVKKRFRPGFVK
jgi:hypothetical protein